MRRTFVALVIAGAVLNAGFAFGDTELRIQRVESKINSGFKERVYIDGKNRLTLTNGKSGVVTVPNGVHKIYAELYTLKTDEVTFNAAGGSITIRIVANALTDFAAVVDSGAPAPVQPAGGGNSGGVVPQRPAGQSTLEDALDAAADEIMAGIQPEATVAVVNIASEDIESAEFVFDALAYILLISGFDVVDRKSLEDIRAERNLQLSWEVDDAYAVSIGKFLGAGIVITGSVSGTGSRRRLVLKALDVTTTKLVAMAFRPY
ncbi:MAG: CsgG/HfaB family protein [Treponema sp.]|jgi:hypothetical protein|nr:CsgG/HfaB family protein [Treponema sp.]